MGRYAEHIWSRKPTVYTLLAADNSILYIGSTERIGRRIGDHALEKSWWLEVATIQLERPGSIGDMLERERYLLHRSMTVYNKTHKMLDDAEGGYTCVCGTFTCTVISQQMTESVAKQRSRTWPP